MDFIIIFIGGAIGTVLRYLVTLFVPTTIVLWLVNGVGSFLMGCLQAYFSKQVSSKWKLFLTTGILGAFTTFSAFSSQWFELMTYSLVLAVLYMVGMTLFCTVIASFGYLLIVRKEREY